MAAEARSCRKQGFLRRVLSSTLFPTPGTLQTPELMFWSSGVSGNVHGACNTADIQNKVSPQGEAREERA